MAVRLASRQLLCKSNFSIFQNYRCFSASLCLRKEEEVAHFVHLPGVFHQNMRYKAQFKETSKKDHSKTQLAVDKNYEVVIAPESGKTDLAVVSGVPEEQYTTRRVRIFRPAKNAMQSGAQNTKRWKIEFDTQERWENPTMGWTSNADPLSNVPLLLNFDTKDAAIDFVERHGWEYFIDEAKEKKMRPKSYGANFSWNKRTRRAMK